MDNIFKKGDRVFCALYGWGAVSQVDKGDTYTNKVDFDNGERDSYTVDGRRLEEVTKTLSFTEYTLDGFSQERPINYDEWVGRWCWFWDGVEGNGYVSKYKQYFNDMTYKHQSEHGERHSEVKLLSETVIKELGL